MKQPVRAVSVAVSRVVEMRLRDWRMRGSGRIFFECWRCVVWCARRFGGVERVGSAGCQGELPPSLRLVWRLLAVDDDVRDRNQRSCELRGGELSGEDQIRWRWRREEDRKG